MSLINSLKKIIRSTGGTPPDNNDLSDHIEAVLPFGRMSDGTVKTIPEEYLPDGKVGKDTLSTISPIQSIPFAPMEEMGGMYCGIGQSSEDMTDGKYEVKWNNDTFTCEMTNSGMGNLSITGGVEDNGLPFAILAFESQFLVFPQDNTLTTVNIEIKKVKPIPLKSEYMPQYVEIDFTKYNFPTIKDGYTSFNLFDENEACFDEVVVLFAKALLTGCAKFKFNAEYDIRVGGTTTLNMEGLHEVNINILKNGQYYLMTTFLYNKILTIEFIREVGTFIFELSEVINTAS